MSGLESDVCKIQQLHVTLEGPLGNFRISKQRTLFVYSLHKKLNKISSRPQASLIAPSYVT